MACEHIDFNGSGKWTRTRYHRASKGMLLAVVKSTTQPRILRNGLTPRTSSSTAHTMVAANERTPNVVFGVPFGILNRRTIDKAMETDNATFGHWATVSPPVRRLTNIHRSASSKFRRAAPLPVRIMRRHHDHPAQGCQSPTGAVSPGRTQPSQQLRCQTNRTRFDPRIAPRNQRVARFRAPAGEDFWPPRPAARTWPRSLGRRPDG